MISTGQILCDPRSKWYQASQQFMPDVPIYNIDLPYPCSRGIGIIVTFGIITTPIS